jgi:hypothetical protein
MLRARARWARRSLGCAALAIALVHGPAAAQGAAPAPARLTLAGPAPKVRTQAELVRFLDDLESQQFLLTNAVTTEAYYQWKGEAHHLTAPFARFLSATQVNKAGNPS